MRVLFGLLTLGVVVFMESSALGNIKSPLPAPEVIFTPPRITSIMNIYMRYIENLASFSDGLYQSKLSRNICLTRSRIFTRDLKGEVFILLRLALWVPRPACSRHHLPRGPGPVLPGRDRPVPVRGGIRHVRRRHPDLSGGGNLVRVSHHLQ